MKKIKQIEYIIELYFFADWIGFKLEVEKLSNKSVLLLLKTAKVKYGLELYEEVKKIRLDYIETLEFFDALSASFVENLNKNVLEENNNTNNYELPN